MEERGGFLQLLNIMRIILYFQKSFWDSMIHLFYRDGKEFRQANPLSFVNKKNA